VLTIEHLLLRLPEGFEPRARQIALLLAGELAAFTPATDRCIERISLPSAPIEPNASDHEVAGALARAVASVAHLQCGEQL